jgi:hypothetical protein
MGFVGPCPSYCNSAIDLARALASLASAPELDAAE